MEFLDKYKEWGDCLDCHDRNVIMNQIHEMAWNSAVYRLINESRRISRNSEGKVEQNGLIHRFIDHAYFESQVVTVRRIAGLNESFDNETKATWSLGALIRDLKKHSDMLTRKNLAHVLERRIEYDARREEWLEAAIENAGQEATEIPAGDWRLDRNWNQRFDQLAGVQLDQRSQDNVIQPVVFDKLEQRLRDACGKTKDLCDKFVAHAATIDNRQACQADLAKLTFEDVWKAEIVLYQIANILSILLFARGYSPLPIGPLGEFKYIDRPLFREDQLPALKKFWRQLRNENDRWSKWSLEDLLLEVDR